MGGLYISAAPADAFRKLFFDQPCGDSPLFPFTRYAGRYNIGDYIPKDQGGKFIQMALLGTEEDEKIVEAIRGGLIAEVYGEPTGWSRFETTEVEKSVWLNRFYFLPSFARMYHLTGDRSYLDDMMDIIRQWISDNPLLPDSHRTTYNWRDMQVAWRSIHFSWCYYLGEKGLSAEEKKLITDSLEDHAHILATGFGQARLNEFNHQSHGALAMLYLGVLFPLLEEAQELRQKALVILNHHLEHAFYDDGGNVEQMFGYYPFEAHLFRDAFLLCTANGIEPPPATLARLRSMVRYLTAVVRPDGTMPPVNDSYEMPAPTITETINELLGTMALAERQGSVLFPDTQVAVMRQGGDNGWYLLANPAPVIGSHAHAGRLGFELWHSGMPLMTESGCCNYDDPALVKWYRTTRAHNSVIIDGVTEAATSSDQLWVPRRETPNRITSWMPGDEISCLTMVSPPEEATNAGVRWSRTISLVGDRLAVISDTFETGGEHRYEILLHLPHAAVITGLTGKSLTVSSGITADVIAACPGSDGGFSVTEGMVSLRGVTTMAPLASFVIQGKGIVRSHLLVVPWSGDGERAKVKCHNKKGTTHISVSRSGEKAIRIALATEGVRLL